MTMRFASAFLAGSALALASLPAAAVDGGFAAQGTDTTYYQQATQGQPLAPLATAMNGAASGGLPTALYAIDAAGGVTYHDLGQGNWQVDIAVAPRPAERVDAVYDLVLALPLPAGSTSSAWRIKANLGTAADAGPLLYGGEPLVLRRNVPLERAWLPVLTGAASGLPDLSRTGYVWTLWDTIVRYDASAGATLQGYASFRYAADPRVGALDPSDPDNGAYVINWIPTLETVPPFAIRLHVLDGKE